MIYNNDSLMYQEKFGMIYRAWIGLLIRFAYQTVKVTLATLTYHVVLVSGLPLMTTIDHADTMS